MARITHEMHDRCIATAKAIKAANPDLAARAMRRDGTPLTDPAEIALSRKLMALSAVASTFATGDRPRASDMKLAEALVAGRDA